MRGAGSGDRLARGSVKASYIVTEDKRVTQEMWDEMFADFDPKTFEMPKSDGKGPKEAVRSK